MKTTWYAVCEFCDKEFDLARFGDTTHIKNCQGCRRDLLCEAFTGQRKRCNDCCEKRRHEPKKLCIYKGCKTRPNFGKEGSIVEYCKKHAPVGYSDTRNQICKNPNCKIRPNFGKEGSKTGEYCKKHAPIGYINVTSKTCKEVNCKTQPTYGKNKTTLAEYCREHKPLEYVDVVNKTCKDPNCKTRPTFGKEGTTIAEYCSNHKLEGYINVKGKTCKALNCNIQPSFGKEGNIMPEYCSNHKLVGYVNIVSKTCNEPNCKIRPNFGKEGTTLKEYCKQHAPVDYVDVASKTCKIAHCKTRPHFGKKGTTLAEFCNKHKLEEYVNVVHNICQDCNTHARYAIPSAKNINQLVLNKPTHCNTHKQDGMIIIKNCLIKNCKNSALFGTLKPIHCEEHKNSNDICLVERKCKECSRIETVNDDGICWNYCVATTIYNKQYKKFQTVKQNRVGELLKKEINIDLFCTDKAIEPSCSMRRPDFVYDLGSHIVIVEVDERAGEKSGYHKEKCEKERIRMFELSNSFMGRPIIFIRYNPDNYHINNIIKKTPAAKREILLLKWVNKAINHNDFPTNKYFPTVLTVYLYYNEYDECISEFKELSQDNMTKGLIPCVK